MLTSQRCLAAITFWFVFLTAPASAQCQRPRETAPPQPPVKIAEGKYGSQDSWTLWSTPDGLKAEIQIHWAADVAKGGTQQETLDLAPDLTLRRFRYETRKLPSLGDLVLDCHKAEKSLECVTTAPKQTGRGNLPFAGAYTVQFGVEMAFLDMPWFYTTLLAESDRDPQKPRKIGIVTIAFDGKTPDTLVTGNGSTADVKYLGTENIRVLGRPVKGHKFQITARHYSATAWTADCGLLLAADWAGMHMELTEFKQYVEMVPELAEAEKSPASTGGTATPPPKPQ